MDVSAEAKRIMVQALSKMYSSRSQRGGLRLHRSLLLTLVMKSARDIYHTARATSESQDSQEEKPAASDSPSDPPRGQEESMDTSSPEVPEVPPKSTTSATEPTHAEVDQENRSPVRVDRHSRKRRGKTATVPDFLPCKRAKMDSGEVLRILQDATLRSNSGQCARETDTLPGAHMLRTVATC
ncbi:immediate early response gene 2 protein [Colossoma macropomum]|uniref:immediate early response gene 2 protein n=1 Tax=Colossoma macropomum TaxID=42526 RepID=UPI001863B58D|nr:immediate early response gene 2 protein [Colossoma macropomum]